MRIEMRAHLSGTRDGADWPPVGGVLEVPDAEGAALCASGHARPVVSEPKTERAVAPAVEKRTPRKPKSAS